VDTDKPTIYAVIDVETTGLDPINDYLLEIACVLVTSDTLEELAQYESVVFHADPLRPKDYANDYVRNMHAVNGLWDEIAQPVMSKAQRVIDRELSEMLAPYQLVFNIELAGASPRLDLNFVEHKLHHTYAALHYHFADVSGFRRALGRWTRYESLDGGESNHRAMDDVEFTLREMRDIKKFLDTEIIPL
jgi:oligoribonuclease